MHSGKHQPRVLPMADSMDSPSTKRLASPPGVTMRVALSERVPTSGARPLSEKKNRLQRCSAETEVSRDMNPAALWNRLEAVALKNVPRPHGMSELYPRSHASG